MGSFREIVPKKKYKLTVELGYVGGKRKKKNKTVEASGPREAQRLLTLFEAEVYSKHIIDDTKMTVQQFYHQWLDNYAQDHYGPRTFKDTTQTIEKRILPEIGPMKIKDVKKIHIINFINELKKESARQDGRKGTLSSSSIRNIYKALNALFKMAEAWELIDRNPCEKVPLPPVSHKKHDIYTLEESKQLFKLLELEEPKWQLIVQIAAIVGAREGEIAALEEKHLDMAQNAITIEQSFVSITGEGLHLKSTKTNRTRKVSIPESLMKDLKKWRLYKLEQKAEVGELWKWPKHIFLFSDEFGQPMRPDSISQRWSRFVQRHKLKKIRFHDLRHTSASFLIAQGVHAKIIQERLGHSKIGTTMDTYGHVFQEAEQSSASHFESLYKKN